MSSPLPPYSIKSLYYNKNKDANEQVESPDKNQSITLNNVQEILKNKLLIDTDRRGSMTFKTEEEKNNTDGKKRTNEIFITPFHLNTDPQFKSTLPYLMIESFFLVIVMNINETVKHKSQYQFAVWSSVILLLHHIIMDTSVTYFTKWGRLSTTKLSLLMTYSVLTIISTLMVWIYGDYKAEWVVPKTILFIWCLLTYYTWQCMFIRMYEYRLTVISRQQNNENTIWRSKNDKQKYYQKSL